MAKKLGFKDYLNVDYAPGEPDQVKYNAKKRKVEAKECNCGPDCPCEGKCGPDCNCQEGCGKEVDMKEALSLQQRQKRSRSMKKYASRIKLGKAKAARRMADPTVLKRRARKQARGMIAKKLAKANYSTLSFARKQEIEKRLDKLGPRIDRIAKKLLPKMRKLEQERKRGKKSPTLDKANTRND